MFNNLKLNKMSKEVIIAAVLTAVLTSAAIYGMKKAALI